MMKKWLWLVVGFLGVGFLIGGALQLVPYGRNKTNPEIIQEPVWNTPETREIVKRTCFDCHSNETIWPWYSNIAPVSWLVQRDVEEGRQQLNFSEWNRHENTFMKEAIRYVIQSDSMPPKQYRLLHPEAVLTEAEKEFLLDGLEASLK